VRNTVLVTIDSLRADCCGFLGGEDDLTPTMDKLANDGVAFENAIAPGPRTPSSMPVVWTGEHIQPWNRGVYRSYEEKRSRHMKRRSRIRKHLTRFRTIAERFDQLGYETVGVTANPWTSSDTAFDQGFDEFYSAGEEPGMRREGLLVALANRVTNGQSDEWLVRWTDFYDIVQMALASVSEPYFLWVFLLDPHRPYLAPQEHRQVNTSVGMYYANLRYNKFQGYTDDLPPHLSTRLKRAYKDAVRSTDAFLSRLLSELDRDPAVVVHADHGEGFAEHGFYGHRPQLYEEVVHVPLVIHGIDREDWVEEVLSIRHLPEMLEAIGIDSDDDLGSGQELDERTQFDPRRYVASAVITQTEEEEKIAVRSRDWKYIRSDDRWEYVYGQESEELYYLPDDPDEQEDLVDDQPEAANALRTVIQRYTREQEERNRVTQAVRKLDDLELLGVGFS